MRTSILHGLIVSAALFTTGCPQTLFAQAASQPARKKLLLVGTRPDHARGEHEYMQGLKVLQSCLQPVAGVEAIVIQDWPTAEQWQGADAMFLFCANGGSFTLARPDQREQFVRKIREGMGYGTLHYACDVEAPHEKTFSDEYLSILGAYYETGYSRNPFNTLLLRPANFPHPITRGLEAFPTYDETYYKLRFMPRTEPALVASVKDKDGEFDRWVAWTFERPDGGRSFGFTGGHLHRNFSIPLFRRLLVNGVLWISRVDVPAEGGPIACDEALFVAPPR